MVHDVVVGGVCEYSHERRMTIDDVHIQRLAVGSTLSLPRAVCFIYMQESPVGTSEHRRLQYLYNTSSELFQHSNTSRYLSRYSLRDVMRCPLFGTSIQLINSH